MKRDKDDLAIIKLKATSVDVSLDEGMQVLRYRTELKALMPDARDIDVILTGKNYDSSSRENFPAGNAQRAPISSLDQILQEANSRLSWLSVAFEEEVAEYQENVNINQNYSIL